MFKRFISFFILLSLSASSTFASTAPADESCPAPSSSPSEISTQIEISALYPNPNTGEKEWVEIRNTSSKTIDLSHYTLEDSTTKPWALSGSLEGGESLQIDGFPFQLNNSDETVSLKTSAGTLVDSWTYASSVKGEILSRDNDEEAAEEEEPVEETDESNSESTETPSLWPIFSEALPNPQGSDSTDEWIELYNPYGETLTLTGLQLDDMEGGSSPYKMEGTLAPETYLLISVVDSGLTLNNDADQIRLLGLQKEVLWEISYSNPKEGESYALFGSSYSWTSTPTPNEENQANLEAESASSEEESPEKEETNYENGDLSEEVKLTEVFPNPEGTDNEEEWIEITNGSSVAVNLGNWTITDASGKTYTFPDDTIIEANSTLVLYRPTSQISLNNSNESLALADYTGEVLSEVSYESSEEDQSYAQIQVEAVESTQAALVALGNPARTLWEWVTPSPGEENPIWKQIKGTVTEYDGSLLTLFDGISTWTFTAPESATASLLYGAGNLLLVQASLQDGLYQVMQAELIEKAVSENKKSFPWLFLFGTLGLTGWGANELWKKHKKTLNFGQMALD